MVVMEGPPPVLSCLALVACVLGSNFGVSVRWCDAANAAVVCVKHDNTRVGFLGFQYEMYRRIESTEDEKSVCVRACVAAPQQQQQTTKETTQAFGTYTALMLLPFVNVKSHSLAATAAATKTNQSAPHQTPLGYPSTP